LELLVKSLRSKKCAESSKPRAPRKGEESREPRARANGRYVPRAVVREVVARDGGQCTFEGPDGRRCTARSGLQLDHVIPFAKGGTTTAENLRQLCGPHNQHEAERVFGAEHVRSQREARRARTERERRARAEARAASEPREATLVPRTRLSP
ncbi:MAG: HNH endonuclease signature motif containing protein, partial [Candidatus Eisenbacteria bacterium]